MSRAKKTTLIIFTCETREILLERTLASFRLAIPFAFDHTIIAIDGPFSHKAIAQARPDVVVQSFKRKGYVNNIINALRNIGTPYAFILEDDWSFTRQIDAGYFVDQLETHADWAQISLSKIPDIEKTGLPVNGILYENKNGFTTNPCFVNVKHLKTAFAALEESEKGSIAGTDGFENFLGRYFDQHHLKSMVLDPAGIATVEHQGYLESTDRKWHVTSSIENDNLNSISSIPFPSVARRLLMMAKLAIAFVRLGFAQLSGSRAYDYCFRLITSYKEALKK